MRVAHACGSRCSQELCCPYAHSTIISSHSMFHRTLLGVLDTFSSSCSLFSQTTPTPRLLTGISSTSPLLLRLKKDSLAIWLHHFLTQVRSPSLVSTSAVSTRLSITARGETASTSRMALPPQPQLPRTSTVFISKRQPSVARSMYQRVR